MNIQTIETLRARPFAPPLPHVLILGAGASRAALPNGDKYGRSIPLLDDLPNILGDDWVELEKEAPEGNFESKFDWLRERSEFSEAVNHIELILRAYFSALELPGHPTIYDYLVLGLRPKDVIATFNWDPFLMQAVRRNRNVAPLPDIRFLHGSVDFATCPDHDILGVDGEECPSCHKVLVKGPLIFPESAKDYTRHLTIQRDWDAVSRKLKKAFHLTIFGYSGPATDFKARELLLEGWRATPMIDICHAEIIDIRPSDVILETWEAFFPNRHDIIHGQFWNSSIAKWPRRTAEWKIPASLYGMPSAAMGPFRTNSLRELQEWFRDLACVEEGNGGRGQLLKLDTARTRH